MIFVSLLVNNCHGDKMRKKTAREYLWAAQNGDAYICKSSGILVSSQERQNAYRKLTDAESLALVVHELLVHQLINISGVGSSDVLGNVLGEIDEVVGTCALMLIEGQI